MTATPKVLGTTDSRNECECCGRQGLKKTVALSFDGDVRFYGTSCALTATGRVKRPGRSAEATLLNSRGDTFEARRAADELREFLEAEKAEKEADKAWSDHLDDLAFANCEE